MYMSLNPYDYLFKIIVIGNAGTGKSSLCTRLIEGRPPYHYDTTIGVEFFSKIVTYRDFESNSIEGIKMHLWDTAGQESFRSIIRSYYRDISGVFLVFDVTKKGSFKDLKYWLDEIKTNGPSEENKPQIIVLANKSDMPEHKIEVAEAEIDEFCAKYKLEYFYTNMRDDSIEIAANKLIDKIYKEYKYGVKKENHPGIRLAPEKMELKLNNKKYRDNVYYNMGGTVKEKCCTIM